MLSLAQWQDTYATLHMWTQIVGKVRMALSPRVNHWWGVTLYVTPRGLTTSSIPYGDETFELLFDFIDHKLYTETSWGERASIDLAPKTVAEFYGELMGQLKSLGIEVKIWPMPVEVPAPIRFDRDDTHGSYDANFAHRFWRILVSIDTVFKEFRAGFIGKCSPAHFYWGSFDYALTRFSGRRAPLRPEASAVTQEAYSHEVISGGFWPGGGAVPEACFYCYAAPEPTGFPSSQIRPSQAYYSTDLHEFLLRYDDVRLSENPKATLLDFLQSTYDAGATLAKWDRGALERRAGQGL